jgi:hypothetical protein
VVRALIVTDANAGSDKDKDKDKDKDDDRDGVEVDEKPRHMTLASDQDDVIARVAGHIQETLKNEQEITKMAMEDARRSSLELEKLRAKQAKLPEYLQVLGMRLRALETDPTLDEKAAHNLVLAVVEVFESTKGLGGLKLQMLADCLLQTSKCAFLVSNGTFQCPVRSRVWRFWEEVHLTFRGTLPNRQEARISKEKSTPAAAAVSATKGKGKVKGKHVATKPRAKAKAKPVPSAPSAPSAGAKKRERSRSRSPSPSHKGSEKPNVKRFKTS